MFTLRFILAVALILGGTWATAQAQSLFGSSAGDKKTDKPPVLPNEHLKNGVPSMFGQTGPNQFHTPVGQPGARANVFDAPATPGVRQLPTPPSTPGMWQRFKNFIGLGEPTPTGTVPQQIPPGSVDPKVFGGR